ncbi:MAG: DUF418 domain-containing protein [Bryobacteraceae bacterium]|nr:DUF418 domain-containing protein [Bryobacteraceae bacterium]
MSLTMARIDSLDALRGFSLLGILLLNIASFGLPFAAYMNPAVAGGADGINLATWFTAMALWDGKMRCIFSMLFGASAWLLVSRAEERGDGIFAADIYYRRTMWLILIGLLHAHFIWAGDILYGYGVIGLLLFPLRNLKPKTLIITGLLLIALHSLQNLGAGYGIGEMAQSAKSARAKAAPTEAEKKAMTEYAALEEMFTPSAAQVQKEIAAHRGGWVGNLVQRSGEAALLEFTMFFQFFFLDVLAMQILGMGLAKAGVFSAQKSYGFYGALVLAGFAIGAPLHGWAASRWHSAGFAIPEYFAYIGVVADPSRLLVGLAYVGLVMMAAKAGLTWITAPLAAVGRTALSNYLLTSILMTLFFNGYGLGYFAKLERHQLYWVVAGMWVINLALSPLWLKYFRYGPAEWVWRSLTYWQKQPMRLTEV